MTQKAIPGTSVLERHYPHPVARVFRAWGGWAEVLEKLDVYLRGNP
jgi:uncharacterized protein YndB with AHSA1/START domain